MLAPQAKIRWLAWRKLSGRPQDLRYVFESVLAMIAEHFRALRSRGEEQAHPFHADSD